MIGIGYFAEHYDRGYPAFQAAVLSAPEKAKVLEYLKSGSVFAAAPGIMKDAFTNRRIPGGNACLYGRKILLVQ